MTPQEQKLKTLAENFVDKDKSKLPLFLLDEIQSLEKRVDKIEEISTQEISDIEERIKNLPIPTFPDVQKVAIEGAEIVTIKGEKGDAGEKGETGDAGADGIGINGKDGVQGEQGIQGEQGEKGDRGDAGLQGENGKDGSPDTAEQVRDKIESLKGDEMLDAKYIKGLSDQIEALKTTIQNIPRGRIGGSRKVPMTRVEDLTSQVDGIVTTYTLPRDTVRVHMVWSTQFPIILRPTTDFTFAGQTLTLTSQVGVIQSGQTLTCMIETLFYA